MLRSLYAGISGLRAEQTALDVTANNIANVNTIGFKSSSVQFEDTLSQTISAAGLATANVAGTNSMQVGLGVRIAGITTSQTEGSSTETDNNLDSMISGNGYYVVNGGGTTEYTRNGSFTWDTQGRLSTASGGLVQGWMAASDGTIATGLAPTTITYDQNATYPASATTKATMSGNLPSDAASGTQVERDITTFGSDGTKKSLAVTFTAGSTAGTWSYSATLAGGTAVTGTLTSTNGVLSGATSPSVDGVTLDMTGMTGYAGTTSASIASQDGLAAGSLSAIGIGTDGTITGTFSNGATRALARISVATFTNPQGLTKAGDSTYLASINSGNAKLTTAGENGAGTMIAGYTEASNVDLSQEFTNLIVAQRGFQANARVITTSDTVLQTLIQMNS